jgi:hypothetical protein
MPFPRTPWLVLWFPALLAAQRPGAGSTSSGAAAVAAERQQVTAGVWAEARYNYAYWDAVRANWDSAFAATTAAIAARPVPTDVQFVRRLRRWGALLNDGQFELFPRSPARSRVRRWR